MSRTVPVLKFSQTCIIYFFLFTHSQKSGAESNRRNSLYFYRDNFFIGTGLHSAAARMFFSAPIFAYARWFLQTILYLTDHSMFFDNHFGHVVLGLICILLGVMHLLMYVCRMLGTQFIQLPNSHKAIERTWSSCLVFDTHPIVLNNRYMGSLATTVGDGTQAVHTGALLVSSSFIIAQYRKSLTN